jgi:hypothetical protein
LFVLFSTMATMLVGCLLFCMGLFVAMAFLTLLQAHLHCQLYEIYLARGGEPIPLRPLPAPPTAH